MSDETTNGGASERTIIQKLTTLVRGMDPQIQEGSETFNAALVLLAALSTGTGHGCRRRIANLTGVPYQTIRQFADRLVKAGVWMEGGTAPTLAPWDEEPMAFWCDVNIALGYFEIRQSGDETDFSQGGA